MGNEAAINHYTLNKLFWASRMRVEIEKLKISELLFYRKKYFPEQLLKILSSICSFFLVWFSYTGIRNWTVLWRPTIATMPRAFALINDCLSSRQEPRRVGEPPTPIEAFDSDTNRGIVSCVELNSIRL